MPSSGETKLTKLVREVLSQHQPLGAYEIAKQLSERTGRPGYANTVYRIIAPMVRAGEVVTVASVKGWILADRRWEHRLILLCEQCKQAEQVAASSTVYNLQALCRDHNFKVQQSCLEVLGKCSNCCTK